MESVVQTSLDRTRSCNPRHLFLRYGHDEIHWEQLANLVHSSFSTFIQKNQLHLSMNQHRLCNSRGALNLLLMDNIRRTFRKGDPLKLKDMVRVGLRFKASLPSDKVYGLIGVAQDSHAAFLRPNISRAESLGLIVDDRLGREVGAFRALMARNFPGLSGMLLTNVVVNSLLDQVHELHSPEEMIDRMARMNARTQFGFGGPERARAEHLRGERESDQADRSVPVDYSKNSSVEQIYIHVAKDFISEGDVSALFRLAGIGQKESKKMMSLPSWVPDWSATLERYVLPRVRPHKPNSGDKSCWLRTCRNGGYEFLHIAGVLVGRIERLQHLSGKVGEASPTDVGAYDAKLDADWNRTGTSVLPDPVPELFTKAKKDSLAQYVRFSRASYVAGTHEGVKRRYGTDDEVYDATWLTALANTLPNDGPPSSEAISAYTGEFLAEKGDLPAALRTPDDGLPWQLDSQGALNWRTTVCERYLRRRRLQTSSNSIFAHFVRSEVLPSFASYRSNVQDEPWMRTRPAAAENGQEDPETAEVERIKRAVDMFSNPEGGALAGFAGFVDYSLGRRLAITDEGFLALVPDRAKTGDVLLWLEEENIFLVLRPAKCKSGCGKLEASCGCTGVDAAGQQGSGQEESARYVGDSYVHEFISKRRVGELYERRRFRLW